MKLYGNIKSERASKGQGGNDYLEVEILNANKDVVATVKVSPDDSGKVKLFISNNPKLADVFLVDRKECKCVDPMCAKCLLVNCQDDDCEVHPLSKKKEFREMYKNR